MNIDKQIDIKKDNEIKSSRDDIDNLTEEEIEALNDTLDLTPLLNELEKTMEIDINEQ